jgi:uncharacterized protein YbbC (DUF1343 family)
VHSPLKTGNKQTRIGNLCISLLVLASTLPVLAQTPKVMTGIDVLKERKFDVLRGKRVGLITNPTGVDGSMHSTIDILFRAPGVNLTALFGPEHGIRGEIFAGQAITNSTDAATGLPVYSLYGRTSKPTPEMLKDIDALVYDLQDNGCRSYTYVATMGRAMAAAAENNKEFVVLDRPNPLGGNKIEGNMNEKPFQSSVNYWAVPYVYGLTCGELAEMAVAEGMLPGGVKCKLTVVPMKGWKREMTYSQTGLQWVMASPHQPEADSAIYYVTTGIMGELGVISEGVGYTLPFHMFAAPWIDQKAFADKLNALNLKGVLFRPLIFKPYYFHYKDQELPGVQLYITDSAAVNLTSLQFIMTDVHNQMYPDKNPFQLCRPQRHDMFDKVCGSDKVRKMFTERMAYADIKNFLDKDVESFRARAKKYYKY